MKRTVHPTTPGGLNQSAAKKSRLADLHRVHAEQQQASNSSAAVYNRSKSRPAQKSQPPAQEATTAASQPPYHLLDPSVAAGPLRRAWQAPAASLTLGNAAQPTASSSSTASARTRRGGSQRIGSNKAPTTNNAAGDALDMLTDTLLATNPALAGRPAEAHATAGLRVRDRSVLLDNPPAAPKTGQAKSTGNNSTGYASQLRPLRARHAQGHKQGIWIPRGCVSYQELLPLQQAWRKYIVDHIACIAQQQQQQQSAVRASNNNGSGTVSDAIIMRALLQADLHGSVVRVVACRNPLLVGIEGMVTQAARNAILIVDTHGRQHVVVKDGCEVSVQLPDGRAARLLLSSLQMQAPLARRARTRRRRSQHPAKVVSVSVT